MKIFTFYIQEIKFRLLYILISFAFIFFASCFELHPMLLYLTEPLKNLKVMLTDLPEMYFTMFYLSCYTSFFLVFPIFVYNIWAFLGPALTKKEKKDLNFFFFLNGLNSIFSHCITLCLFLPFVIDIFFITTIDSFFIQVECLPKLYTYTQLIMKIFSVFFFLSQIPGLVFLASKFQLISIKLIAKNRRIFWVFIVLTSAFLSPPEIISQLFISVIGFTLYESMMVYTLWDFHKKSTKKEFYNVYSKISDPPQGFKVGQKFSKV